MTPPRRNARRRPNALASSIAALLLGTAFGPAQTFTSGTGGSFTDTLVWNFGAGPLPASDPALVLGLQSFGGAVVGSNDLNLTLRELDLIGNGTFTLNAQNGGGLAFTGGAGLIDFGSSATMTLGTGITFGTGLTSLTLDGRGPGALTLAGVIASNTSAGAPVIIATDALNPSSGVVTLSGNNTFSGGVVLNSGTLNLASNRALGDAANVLTVNGGSVRTTSSATIENDFALASDLNLDGTFVLTLGGTLSGAGGLTQSGNGASGVVRLTGVNTYTGATTVRGLDHGIAPTDQGGAIHIAGAAGSILTTSGIDVSAGGTLRLVYSEGHSAANARVAGGTAINLGGGFLEVVGNDGVLTHNFGNVTASGLTTILAASNGGNAPSQPGAATEVTIANLTRGTGGTVTFSGENLGTTAVAPNLAAAQGNVVLTQIDGAAPSAALVGGGGAANSTNISILPWALGDFSNLTGNSGAGTGFVTYGPNGVRLLDPTTEYNSTNVLDGLPDGFQNIRVSNSVVDPTGPVTLNSLFIDSAGLSIGGTEVITIGSGALAANADTSISAPLAFGLGGTGEAIVSMVAPLGNPGALTMNLSGTITAGSLVKSGHGTVLLGGAGNSITGGVTINAGQLSVDAITALGGASSLTFRSPSQSAAGAMLNYTGGAADVLNVPVVTDSGMAGFGVDSASLDVSGAISGAGGIRKSGAGTLVLSGVNTYTGGTYLGAGSLEFDTDARLGAAGGFLHTSGGTISLTGPWTSNRTITIDSGVPLTLSKGSNAVAFTGALEGTGPVRVLGSGTVTISAPESGYAGAITLGSVASEGGTLALTGGGSINGASIVFGEAGAPAGTYALDLSGATAPSGTPWRAFNALTTTGAFGQAHSVQLGSSALAPVDVRVSSGSFGGTAGVIQGFGRLVKVGSATLTLNGSLANTFTGGVEVWNGTLSYGADGQLGNAANGITLRGGTLNSTANGTTARAISLAATPLPMLRGTGVVQTIPNALSAASGTARTFSGVLSGLGGLNKSGLGTVTLTGTNTYAGDTQVSAGILAFNSDAQLGSTSSRVRLSPGGTLRLAALTGTVPLNRPVFVLGSGTINVATTAPTLNLNVQLLAAPGSELQLTGPGKFGIGADNRSFFGTLRISSNGAANSIGLAGHLRRANLRVFGVDTSFTMANLVRDLGGITTIDVGSNVQLGSGGQLTTGWNNGNMSWAGEINQSGITPSALFKTGTGTISLTNTSTLATNLGGGFHLLSGTGNTTLSEGGALRLQTAFTVGAWGNSANRGPVLVLSNTSLNSNLRLADAQAFHSNSGEIQLTSNGVVATNEVTGSLRGAGMTTVTMSGGTLNFSNVASGLTRLNGGTFLFRGNNASFGAGVASVSNANLLFGNLPGSALIGGGGAANSTTISILPFAVGGTTASSLGTNFVTYGGNGIRVLNTGSEVVTNTNSASLTGAANDNVRFNNSAFTNTVLTGGTDRTINALNLSGTANTAQLTSAGTERLILDSGLLLNTVNHVFATNAASPTTGIPLGVQVAELQTGAGNTRELNVFTTGGDLALGARVTTSGGLTKSGAANLFLTNATNSYSGPTTINAGSLVIDDLAALGSSTSIVIGGGFLRYRGGDATLPAAVVAAGGASAGLGASAGFHVVSGTTLSLPAGAVSGHGGLLKDGTGVLRLLGANSNSGATIIAGGTLAIAQSTSLGTNSRVIFADSAIATGGQTLRFDAPMTLAQDFVINSSQAGVGFGFDTNGHAVTLNGTIFDARSTTGRGLYKLGAGELNLTATHMFTAPTNVFGGTLRLSGADGSLVNSTGINGFLTGGSVVVNPGASLILDNTTVNNNNRLPDVWDSPLGGGTGGSGAITLRGGELEIRGHAAGTRERVNQISITAATVTLSGGGTTLTSGLLSSGGGNAGLIRGTNLGGTPGAGSTNWFATDLGAGGPVLSGAGGAEATPFVSILPGFMGDTTATGSGTDLLTYATDSGWRTLAPTEYAGTLPNGNLDPSRAPNIALAASANVDLTTLITALKLAPGTSLGGSGSLKLAQGTVLATGATAITAPALGSTMQTGTSALVFLTPQPSTTLSVSSILTDGPITKYGEGTLELNNRQVNAGAVLIAQGTLRLSGVQAALNPLSSPISIHPGATLDLGGRDRVISQLTQSASFVGTNGLGQAIDGTVALGGNQLTIYDPGISTFSGDITGSGGLTKAFASTGVTTFTRPQSYTGTTTVRGGTLALAGAGSLASATIELLGGRLNFNNTDDVASSGYIANRLAPTAPILVGGGEISVTVNPNAPGNHNFAGLGLAGAANLAVTGTASAPTTLTFGQLARSMNRGTLSVNAANLGLTQAPNGGTRIFATQINGLAPTSALIGAGGLLGSSTQSILPWAWAETTGSFLTYGTHGLRPLADSEYAATFGGATSNVRLTAPAVLAGPATANALTTSASVTGVFDLTLTSGGLVTTGASPITIGDSTAQLLTGSGNTRELILNTPNAAQIVTLDSAVTTSGGFTKAGAGRVVLTHSSNTFAGGLQINGGTVQFAEDASLGAAGGAIRFGGAAGASATLSYVSASEAPLIFNRPVVTNGVGTFSGDDQKRWHLDGVISGQGAIRYAAADSGQALYEINAANTYTGPTEWRGGHLFIGADTALGAGGELLLNAPETNQLVLRSDWTTARTIHFAHISVSANASLQTNGYDAIWAGPVAGSSGLVKNGLGRLSLTQSTPWNGALTINAGEVRLASRGTRAGTGSNITVGPGAAFTLDDSTFRLADRLRDAGGLMTLDGGAFTVLGHGGITTEEVMPSLALGAGGLSTITFVPGVGQAVIVRLSAGAFVSGGASLWRGTNLGVNTPGSANSSNFVLAGTTLNTFPLTGGGAPADHPSISIVPGGFGDLSASGSGSQLVTFDATRGVRLLDPVTEYLTTWTDGSAVTDNIKLDSTALALSAPTRANALWLKGGAALSGTGTVTLGAGTILLTDTGNSIANPINVPGSSLAVGGPGSASFTGEISGNGGLIKAGVGTLTLPNANSYTGDTWLAHGELALGNAGALSGGTLHVQGGTLRNSAGGTLSLANGVTLNGTLTIAGTQGFEFTGSVLLNHATREINVAGPGVATISGPVFSTQSLVEYGLTKSGAGTLVLSNLSNSFDGPTTVNAGTLEAAADGSLGSTGSVTVNTGGTLLLSGSGNRINDKAAIQLNGGEFDTGGTSEGTGTSAGLGTLTLSAASTIDFTGAPATLTFAAASFVGGVLSITNWSGLAETAGVDGVSDRLVFAGDNAARLAFLGNFSQSSISFAGFGFGYSAIQFDPGYFEIVPVPEPSAAFGAVALLGLAAFRERRRERRASAASRSKRS